MKIKTTELGKKIFEALAGGIYFSPHFKSLDCRNIPCKNCGFRKRFSSNDKNRGRNCRGYLPFDSPAVLDVFQQLLKEHPSLIHFFRLVE